MSNVENECPQARAAAAREVRRVAAAPPDGVKLVLKDDDLSDVHALIDGPAGTPYFGGVFRVRLALGREFPAAPPRAYFETRIFHPNVAPRSGEVCVSTLRRDWRPELGLAHALLALRCLLIAPNADSALDAEAAQLLRDKYDDYFARAKLLTDIHARPSAAHKEDRTTSSDSEERVEGPRGEGGPSAKRERRDEGEGGAGGAGPPEGGREGAARAPRDRRRVLKRL